MKARCQVAKKIKMKNTCGEKKKKTLVGPK